MRLIGGTDVGPIVVYYRPELAPELAKYATAADVWLRLVHNIERPRTAVMGRGIDAEPRLRRAYEDWAKTDSEAWSFEQHERPWIVPHPRHAFATCSPDDVRSDGILVEYKSTSIFARSKWGDAETDAIPDLYQLQVQWCLEILNLETAHLFVGFGRDFKDENGEHQFLFEESRRYVCPRDRELAAMALEYGERFWKEHVTTRTPPSVQPCNNKRAFARLLKEAANGSSEHSSARLGIPHDESR